MNHSSHNLDPNSAQTEASGSEWSNQRQEISASIRTYMEMMGILQYHEMPATINVRYLTRYMPQNVSYSPEKFRYLTFIPRNVKYICYSRFT